MIDNQIDTEDIIIEPSLFLNIHSSFTRKKSKLITKTELEFLNSSILIKGVKSIVVIKIK